jgi:hypothetical protein
VIPAAAALQVFNQAPSDSAGEMHSVNTIFAGELEACVFQAGRHRLHTRHEAGIELQFEISAAGEIPAKGQLLWITVDSTALSTLPEVHRGAANEGKMAQVSGLY